MYVVESNVHFNEKVGNEMKQFGMKAQAKKYLLSKGISTLNTESGASIRVSNAKEALVVNKALALGWKYNG